jgi:hypothetical protein
MQLGCPHEGESFFWWLLHASQLTHPRLRLRRGWGEDGALDAIKAYADTIDAVACRTEGAVQPPTETVDGVHTIAV